MILYQAMARTIWHTKNEETGRMSPDILFLSLFSEFTRSNVKSMLAMHSLPRPRVSLSNTLSRSETDGDYGFINDKFNFEPPDSVYTPNTKKAIRSRLTRDSLYPPVPVGSAGTKSIQPFENSLRSRTLVGTTIQEIIYPLLYY